MRLRTRFFAILTVFTTLAACSTPAPLGRDELVDAARHYLDARRAESPSLEAPWTLHSAIRRALSSDLEFRVSRLEAAIATGDARLANISLLPGLVADAGYRVRSVNEPRTSIDKESVDGGLSVSWNVLDFGTAYFHRRELADKAHQADEARRRVMQGMIRDVVHQWYQVRAWQQLAPELDGLRQEVNDSLHQSDEVVRQRLGDPVKAVEYRSALLLVLRRLDTLALQLDQARDQLAQTLHLPPGVTLQVAEADGADASVPPALPAFDTAYWQSAALLHRPEMRMTRYEGRAAQTAARRRMLDAFPGLMLRYGSQYDGNAYLSTSQWEQGSASLSWNLMRLAAVPGLRRNAKLTKELAQAREEAMSAAVLAQVSIAGKAYARNRNTWCLSKSLLDLDDRRRELLAARSEVAAMDRLSYVRARLDSALLRTESSLQFAELEKSRLGLLQSAGLLELPSDGDAAALDGALDALLRADAPDVLAGELKRVGEEFALPAPSPGSTAEKEGACAS